MLASFLLSVSLLVSTFTSSAFASPVDLKPRQDPKDSDQKKFSCGNGMSHEDMLKVEEAKLTSALETRRSLSEEKRTNSHHGSSLEINDLLEFSKLYKTKIVPVYFHVIYVNETVEGGYLPKGSILSQMTVLNDAFSASGIQFVLKSKTYTKNKIWFEKASTDANGFANHYDKEMKHALGVKGAGNLNVYTVQTKEAADVTVNLGYAQYPWSYLDDPEGDGIVMQHYTLPDSGVIYDGGQFSDGITLVHEMGHSLGLYHTFNQPEGCDEKHGDQVADTPAEKSAAWPTLANPMIGRDTCPLQSGLDPINNDYAPDVFSTTFTIGQSARMIFYTELYRGI
ncbi:hypothetical protein BDY24DRAFT_385607 [Mrakia frigida]|uniref:zinc metalloprotease n=1 Tax=Mrakia frigida TaxID=29902 RepID=UPI003FCBF7C3